MTLRSSFVLTCLFVTASCAHAPRSSTTTAAPKSQQQLETEQIAATLGAIRGLAEKSALDVRVVDDATFIKAFHAKSMITPEAAERELAAWVAFGFAAPNAQLNQIVSQVLDEQVLGFYDPKTHALYVHRDMPKAFSGNPDSAKSILAHEIEHALQDQYFGFPDFEKLPDDDARFARAALYEGDAMAAMVVYLADKAHKPVADALLRSNKIIRVLPSDALIQMSGQSPALLKAPAMLREGLLFPYFAGMQLVGALYRTGGFALVNQLFAHPPASTEQVLHPEKYVAGEPPIGVAAPALPAGYRRITGGVMGELGTRTLLEQCLAHERAARDAAGWGGDRFVVGEGPNRSLAVVWSTVWDDEAQAARFEAGLRAQASCWKTSDGHDGKWAIDSAVAIRREGAKVAFVRGLAADADAGALTALLRLPESPVAARPPLAVTTLAPEGALPEDAQRGTVAANVYTSERLRLRAEIPPGFEANTTSPQIELMIRRGQPSISLGVFAFLPALPNAQLLEQFFSGTSIGMTSALGKDTKLVVDGGGDVDFGWAKGKDRSWRVEGRPLHLRAILLPGCAGKAGLGFTELWVDAEGRELLDRFIASFRKTDERVAPACVELAAAPPKS